MNFKIFMVMLTLLSFLGAQPLLAQTCTVEELGSEKDSVAALLQEQMDASQDVLDIKSSKRLLRINDRVVATVEFANIQLFDIIPSASESCADDFQCFMIDNFVRIEEVVDRSKEVRKLVRRMITRARKTLRGKRNADKRKSLIAVKDAIGFTTQDIKLVSAQIPTTSLVCLPA